MHDISFSHPKLTDPTITDPLVLLKHALREGIAMSSPIDFEWHLADRCLVLAPEKETAREFRIPSVTRPWCMTILPSLLHHEDQPVFRRHLNAALRGAAREAGSCKLALRITLDNNDAAHWIELSGCTLERNALGRPSRLAGTIAHLGERRQSIKPCHAIEDEKIPTAILTAALDCIISINHMGEILSLNNAAEQTFGYRGEEIIGRRLSEVLIPEPWRRKHEQELEKCRSSGISHLLNRRMEVNAMHADGSTLAVEMTVVPLSVDDNPIFTVFIRDISELKRDAIRYQQLVDLSPEAILVCQNDRLAMLNRAAENLLCSRTDTDLVGRRMMDFIHRDFHAVFSRCTTPLQADASGTPFVEQVWLKADGSSFHAEIGISQLNYNGAPALQVVVRDITARKQAESLQLGQNRILNMVATGADLMEILHELACFVERHSDQGLCSIRQLNTDRTALENCVAPSLPREYIDGLGSVLAGPAGGSCGTAAYRLRPVMVTDIASDPLWASNKALALRHGLKACTSWPIFGKNHTVLGTFALYFRHKTAPSIQDLHLFTICTHLAGIAMESRASEDRIRYLAHYDGLTSLPNRFLFKEYLDDALRNAQRYNRRFAVLFLDLDRFKEINDTMGHEAGDHVLREVAGRMRGCLRETDKIARMGGDEFYVLIECLDDSRHAADIAQKLLNAASQPIMMDGRECRISVSIGIGIYPDDGTTGAALVKNADKAMYRAKERGKNAFHFFSVPAANDQESASPDTSFSRVRWLGKAKAQLS